MIKKHYHRYETLFRYAKMLGFGEIYNKMDAETGLNAIIAIHSTTLGPGLGGCRYFHYQTSGEAMEDALRLAYMMSIKAAFCNLPYGGAKAVLIKPNNIPNRTAYFKSFGDFVNELNGKFITAVDVGTTTEDMDIIAERTPYVIGAVKMHQQEHDPAPSAALGVLKGIQAAVAFKLKREHLSGLHIIIQGAGHVGYHLAKLLCQYDVKLTMSDISDSALQRCVNELNVNIVEPDAIYSLAGDVFSPCAMGGIINATTINQFQTPIIAGSANNQLAHHVFGRRLHEKNILYAPDFVINSGGLISAVMDYAYRDKAMANEKIDQIYDNMLYLFERATQTNSPTAQIAEVIALEKIKAHRQNFNIMTNTS